MRRGLIVGLILFVMGAASAARADVKLAYVDVQRALNECEAGKKAKAEFRGKIQQVESQLQRQQDSIQALKDELEKKGMLMKPEERQNIQDDYARKLRDFENNYKDSEAELKEKDNEYTAKIVHDLAYVIRQLGEKEGYTMVMEKGSILWGVPSIDITDQVIRTYNAMGGRVGSLGGEGFAGGGNVAAQGGGGPSAGGSRPSIGNGLTIGKPGSMSGSEEGGSTITK